MRLSSDDLERIAYAPGGDLATLPFPVLLVAYAALRRTLLLKVSRGPVSKLVTVVDGTPVDCQSNLLQDTLGRYLVGRGQLSEAQVESLEAESQASDRPFEQLLAEKGWVEAELLARSQQQHLARKLLDAFAWDSGSFECARLASSPDLALKLKVPQLLLMGVEKLAPAAYVAASIAAHAGKPFYLNARPIFPLTELRLNAQQRSLVESLRSGKRIEELDPTGADIRIQRLLYALGLLGLLSSEMAAEPAAEPEPQPAPSAVAAPKPPAQATPAPLPPPSAVAAIAAPVPPPAVAVPGAPPPVSPPRRAGAPPPRVAATPAPPGPTVPSPAAIPAPATMPVTAPVTRPVPQPPSQPPAEERRHEQLARRREVLELYERLRGLDAFDLLSLAPTAAEPEIQRAFLAFAERTAPWSLGGGDIEGKARELFLAGTRAFAELGDPERRVSLQARRQSPIAKAQDGLKAAREAFKIQTTLLDPRRQFEKGVKLIQNKRYPEALEQLQYAVDCDPQNAAYRAELARCHWLSAPAARARGSVRELEEATSLDPECGIAFLYLGEILVSLERIEEAREALKRAAHLLLPDRRGLEMLNALPAPGRKGAKLGKWF